jgi:hypothetical protein
MKQNQLFRGLLAMAIGALALWKGVAAAEVTSVDRHEAVTIRGESDAILASIPLLQTFPDMSCTGSDAKPLCNDQPGISNDCVGKCASKKCVVPDNAACFFCHPAVGLQVKSCIPSAVFTCYSTNGLTRKCGPKTKGSKCATFASPKCVDGEACKKACKDTKMLTGEDCNALRDSCFNE